MVEEEKREKKRVSSLHKRISQIPLSSLLLLHALLIFLLITFDSRISTCNKLCLVLYSRVPTLFFGHLSFYSGARFFGAYLGYVPNIYVVSRILKLRSLCVKCKRVSMHKCIVLYIGLIRNFSRFYFSVNEYACLYTCAQE